MILHFKNYGQSVAEDTLIELWPAVSEAGKPAIVQEIPAFQGHFPTGPHKAGRDIPPGFPFQETTFISSQESGLVENGEADLNILGRISYRDAFGTYCSSFGVRFQRVPTNSFVIGPKPMNDYCGGQPQTAIYWMVKVGTTPTQVAPPTSFGPVIKEP